MLLIIDFGCEPSSRCILALDAFSQRVVLASDDKTLKVWSLQIYACLLSHYGDSAYTAVTATETSIVAGGHFGSRWFLD